MQRAIKPFLQLPLFFVVVGLVTACSSAVNWESAGGSSVPVSVVSRASSPAVVAAVAAPEQEVVNTGFYRVSEGDTLYSIAWRYQLDYQELARWNGRENSTLIYSGEMLRLTAPKGVAAQNKVETVVATRTGKIAKNPAKIKTAPATEKVNGSGGEIVTNGAVPLAPVSWQWPAKGVVSNVSFGPQSRLRGMLISGKLGEPVVAAASGTVVHIESAMHRYGSVVILKHSNNMLSTYANLQGIAVQKDQWVTGGSPVGTMAVVETGGSAALRFDIRAGSKAINPLDLLPAKVSTKATQ